MAPPSDGWEEVDCPDIPYAQVKQFKSATHGSIYKRAELAGFGTQECPFCKKKYFDIRIDITSDAEKEKAPAPATPPLDSLAFRRGSSQSILSNPFSGQLSFNSPRASSVSSSISERHRLSNIMVSRANGASRYFQDTKNKAKVKPREEPCIQASVFIAKGEWNDDEFEPDPVYTTHRKLFTFKIPPVSEEERETRLTTWLDTRFPEYFPDAQQYTSTKKMIQGRGWQARPVVKARLGGDTTEFSAGISNAKLGDCLGGTDNSFQFTKSTSTYAMHIIYTAPLPPRPQPEKQTPSPQKKVRRKGVVKKEKIETIRVERFIKDAVPPGGVARRRSPDPYEDDLDDLDMDLPTVDELAAPTDISSDTESSSDRDEVYQRNSLLGREGPREQAAKGPGELEVDKAGDEQTGGQGLADDEDDDDDEQYSTPPPDRERSTAGKRVRQSVESSPREADAPAARTRHAASRRPSQKRLKKMMS